MGGSIERKTPTSMLMDGNLSRRSRMETRLAVTSEKPSSAILPISALVSSSLAWSARVWRFYDLVSKAH